MKQFIGKVFRSILYIAMGTLVGWYNFQINGMIGIFTNFMFAALGGLLAHTWTSQTKNVSAASLEPLSSTDRNTDANAAGRSGRTGRVERTTESTTPLESNS